MSAYQTQVDGKSVIITVKTTDTTLFGLTTETIEQLPVTIHHNYFVAAGTVDKIGYQFRTISFEDPNSHIREIKEILDNIREFVQLQRQVAKTKTDFDNLDFNFKRQEKQLLAYKNKKKIQTDNTLDMLSKKEKPTEIVSGVVVTKTITNKEKITHGNDIGSNTLDSYNTFMRENLHKLPEEVYKASQLPPVLKATFTTYYLLGDGATKVETEYNV